MRACLAHLVQEQALLMAWCPCLLGSAMSPAVSIKPPSTPSGLASSRSESARPDAEVLSGLINLAGRQRMLSQRLTLYVVLAGQGQSGALAMAQEVMALLTTSQRRLEEGGDGWPGLFSPRLESLFDGTAQARQRAGDFIARAQVVLGELKQNRPLTPDAQADLVEAASAVLPVFNLITQAFEEEAQDLARAQQRQRDGLNEEIHAVAREAKVVSFNAQVSAHRAGSAGREFAVVASRMATISEEMARLAQASMSAR